MLLRTLKRDVSILIEEMILTKKKLYKLLVNLPFTEYECEYENDWEEIKNNDLISEDLRKFLEHRNQIKEKWVKCFMKQTFTCGTCTSSRIESKHRVYKKYLNGNSRLCEVFKCFKELEDKQISNYTDEIKTFKKSQESELDKHTLVKEVEQKYSQYVVIKIKEILLESLHYSVEEINENQKWYLLFLFIQF